MGRPRIGETLMPYRTMIATSNEEGGAAPDNTIHATEYERPQEFPRKHLSQPVRNGQDTIAIPHAIVTA